MCSKPGRLFSSLSSLNDVRLGIVKYAAKDDGIARDSGSIKTTWDDVSRTMETSYHCQSNRLLCMEGENHKLTNLRLEFKEDFFFHELKKSLVRLAKV